MTTKSIFTSVSALTLASLLLAAAGAQTLLPKPTATAQDTGTMPAQDDPRAKRLEGVWTSQVSIVDPQTGATIRGFRGLTMFSPGGALNATNNTPSAGLTSGPSFGRWEYLGNKRYSARFRFFRFNLDGSFAGSQRVTRAITLIAGAQSFTSTITFETLDASDTVIQTGAGTEIAVRAE